MISAANDIAKYLAAQSILTLSGQSNFAGYVAKEPATPVNVVTLYDTGGLEPDTDELDVLRPSVQVRVRATDYAAGYAKQEAIRDKLILTHPIITADSVFSLITMQGHIMAIGRDENDRFLLTANYRAIRKRT